VSECKPLSIGDTIRDLEPHQIHTFYEAVGHMISSEVNPAKREEYVQRLMEPPNATWNQIMAQARTMGSECLKSQAGAYTRPLFSST
jgi:exportin-1